MRNIDLSTGSVRVRITLNKRILVSMVTRLGQNALRLMFITRKCEKIQVTIYPAKLGTHMVVILGRQIAGVGWSAVSEDRRLPPATASLLCNVRRICGAGIAGEWIDRSFNQLDMRQG